MILTDILQKALDEKPLNANELAFLLNLEGEEDIQRLFHAAYEMKTRHVGRIVRLRGLIEISNICTKDCFYCGIRKSNIEVKRFAMCKDEILNAAKLALQFNYGSVVLQSGEREDAAFAGFITETVRAIKELDHGSLGITLSLGEQTEETYRRWFDAGAHRYLLRIEASDPELYHKLHPQDHSYEKRVNCLRLLRKTGYQLGTGVMIGLPHQTARNLVHDLLFFRELDVDMIGMGPYLVHRQTPLGREFPGQDDRKQLDMSLKMIAVTRLFLKNVNIAATTALQTLSSTGREAGLLAGANVIMPNIGDVAYRHGYQLYENKPTLNENISESRETLAKNIAAIGETLGSDWGDSPHFKAGR